MTGKQIKTILDTLYEKRDSLSKELQAAMFSENSKEFIDNEDHERWLFENEDLLTDEIVSLDRAIAAFEEHKF